MDDNDPFPPDEPNRAGQSRPAVEKSSVKFPQGPSPLGPVGQYRPPAANTPLPLQARLAGAPLSQSIDQHTRRPHLRSPEWTMPTRAIGQTILEYIYSVLTYWFGYGLIMALVLLLSTLALGQMQDGSAELFGRMIAFGPLMALLFDVSLFYQSTVLSAMGAGLIICEFVLFFLLLFSHEWSGRLKYVGFMLALVLCKTAILLLATMAQ